MKEEIAILENIHPDGIRKLSSKFKIKKLTGISRDKYLKKISNSSVIIVKSLIQVDRELLNHTKKLKVIARAGTGLDNIDIRLAKKKKIKV